MVTRPRYIPAATPARLLCIYIYIYIAVLAVVYTHARIIFCVYRRTHVSLVYIIIIDIFYYTRSSEAARHVRI